MIGNLRFRELKVDKFDYVKIYNVFKIKDFNNKFIRKIINEVIY